MKLRLSHSWILIAAAVLAAVLFYSTGWARLPIAVVCGDGIVLGYEKELNVSRDEAFIDFNIKVSNPGFSTLEILGISTPCSSCMDIQGVPASVRPLQSHVVRIHLPVTDLPSGETPVKFKLLCRTVAPERCECVCVLYREPLPVDDRVPTLAPVRASLQAQRDEALEDNDK